MKISATNALLFGPAIRVTDALSLGNGAQQQLNVKGMEQQTKVSESSGRSTMSSIDVPLAMPHDLVVNQSRWDVEVIRCDPACLQSEFCYKPLENASAVAECRPRLGPSEVCDTYPVFYKGFVCGEGYACARANVTVTPESNASNESANVSNASSANSGFLQRVKNSSENVSSSGNASTNYSSFVPSDESDYGSDTFDHLQCVPCGAFGQPPCPHVEMIEGWLPDFLPVPSVLREMLKTHPAPVMKIHLDAEVCVEVDAANVHCPGENAYEDQSSPRIETCVQIAEIAPEVVDAPLQSHDFVRIEQEAIWLAEEYAMYSAGEHTCNNTPAINIPIPHTSVQALHEDPHWEKDLEAMVTNGEWYDLEQWGSELEDLLPYPGERYYSNASLNSSNGSHNASDAYNYSDQYYGNLHDEHFNVTSNHSGAGNQSVSAQPRQQPSGKAASPKSSPKASASGNTPEASQSEVQPAAKSKAAPKAKPAAAVANSANSADSTNSSAPAADLLPMSNPEFPLPEGVGFPPEN